MTYDLVVGDPRTVARVINMAHRFQCRASRVDSTSSDTVTTAHFEFAGDAKQLDHTLGASHSAACSHVEVPSDGRTHSHLQAFGEFGLWGLGCDCFAF